MSEEEKISIAVLKEKNEELTEHHKIQQSHDNVKENKFR
jgi:hypothetical protein